MGSWECLHFRQPDLVPELASRDIGFVLDVGHARLNNALETFAETSAPCHIHFHDNKGTNDDHAACGAGTIDFARILPHLPETASRVIEVSDIAAYEQSVAYLTGLETQGPGEGRTRSLYQN